MAILPVQADQSIMMTMKSSRVPGQFRIPFRPSPDPAAVVCGPNVRFTVLTSRLIRLEFSPQDRFEDRASQAFWHRQQPVPQFEAKRSATQLEIITEHLHLCFLPGPKGFAKKALSIELRQSGALWRFGDRDPGNLRGTARTLDNADGHVYLDPGLVSRSGWAVVDDSAGLVFNQEGWLEPRATSGNLDLYFFGYGHDYLGCLQDFCRVAGPTPLVPRWALGNWWSRYWEYSQAELLQLMQDVESRGIPLSVCIVDMDWHITQTGNASSGWTGYTWNRNLFPDPEGLMAKLHRQGLKVSLNLHPAAGVYPHEAQYPEMARRLGVDPSGGDPVPFDIANPDFAAAYFEVLHHPLEAQGVDFWWVDWQQGNMSQMTGLDPLWWLNHLHFYDLARDGQKRPFVFTRWGGLGSHRYPIGFSGDTIVSWDSLAFQPYFTATAANVGFGWWSHDIGGHFRGIEDPELYTRWVQFGVFSPIFRLHSTKNPYHERLPWGYDAEVFRIAQAAMQLRHALIPYLYSMAWRCAVQGRPLILPMYFLNPEAEEAYHSPNQYLFGSELIAAPFVTPRDADTRLSRQAIWLPAGDWFDCFSGEHYAGDRWHTLYGALDEIPVLAKAGAIVPLGPRLSWGGVANPAGLAVHVFAGAGNRFDLYEDDGDTQAYLAGHGCVTPLIQTWRDQCLQFTIAPAQGDVSLVPRERVYHLTIHGIRNPERVQLAISGQDRPVDYTYDEAAEALSITDIVLAPSDELSLTCGVCDGTLLSRRDRRLATCRKLLRAFRLDSEVKHRIDRDLPAMLEDPNLLMNHSAYLADGHLAALSSVVRSLGLPYEERRP